MKSKLIRGSAIVIFALFAVPATAQSMNHSAHEKNESQSSSEPVQHQKHDASGAEATLAAYREALTAREADAMTVLFAEDSAIFENGRDEGNFAHYMMHHLGPELDAISSFTFGNPTMEVTRSGHMAYARETYTYRIELTDGRVIDREGVATSVLMHDAEGWKIVQYHSSSRAPRNR